MGKLEDGTADWFKDGDVELDGSAPLDADDAEEAREQAELRMAEIKKAQKQHTQQADIQIAATRKAIQEDAAQRMKPGFVEQTYEPASNPTPPATNPKAGAVDTKAVVAEDNDLA